MNIKYEKEHTFEKITKTIHEENINLKEKNMFLNRYK